MNLECDFPFKFNEYVLGFKHSISNFAKAPESFFLKKTYDTPNNSKTTIKLDYNSVDQVLASSTTFESDTKYGLTAVADANTKDYLTKFSVESNTNFNSLHLSKTLTLI